MIVCGDSEEKWEVMILYCLKVLPQNLCGGIEEND
jgi:hypothetical protein